KEKLLSISSVFSAALSAICCIGPLIFVALGIGSVGLIADLVKYRLIFTGVTFFLLGTAFYLTYLNSDKEVCETSNPTCKSGNRLNKIILWIATIIAISFTIFPYLGGML
ncbi:MAG TPA: hypothetical protein EYP22_10240, partial [Methanosarcinales archaeon]|nr:hypothetical protein [Methanosarcinales archaeon]